MKRLALLMIAVLLLGCGSTQTPVVVNNSSPQAVYDSILNAIEQNDYRAIWNLTTEASHSAIIQSEVAQCYGIHLQLEQARDDPKLFGEAGPSELVIEMDRDYQAVLQKHGISYEQLAEILNKEGDSTPGDALLELVENDIEFFNDLCTASQDSRLSLLGGGLVGLKIEGNTAIASESGTVVKVHFEKVGDRWYLQR